MRRKKENMKLLKKLLGLQLHFPNPQQWRAANIFKSFYIKLMIQLFLTTSNQRQLVSGTERKQSKHI